MRRAAVWLACMFGLLVLGGVIVRKALSMQTDVHRPMIITGSFTIEPLMREIMKAYKKDHPEAPVFQIVPTGTKAGDQDVLNKTSDLCMRGQERVPERGHDRADYQLTDFPICYDALVVIVNKKNTWMGMNISKRDLSDIFCGKMPQWAPINKRAAPIHVALPSSETAEYRSLMNGLEPPLNVMDYSQYSIGALSEQQTLDFVRADIDAIGVVSYFNLDDTVSPVLVEGVGPWQLYGAKNPYDGTPSEPIVLDHELKVARETYPFVRPLTLAVLKMPEGLDADEWRAQLRIAAQTDLITYVESRAWVDKMPDGMMDKYLFLGARR